MRHIYKNVIISLVAMLALTACGDDEPYKIKPAEDRTVLAVDKVGNIYDLQGELVQTLPDCEEVIQIISEGKDFFVSGKNTKRKVGYWKNGKWSTLHVDFINDVEHDTFGIAKWDYNIYLLDPPNVLRNSGIFPLEDHEHFSPARHGISVSEGYCFVVGTDIVEIKELTFDETPILYYFDKSKFKKKVLPLPEGVDNGTATGVDAFDGNHYVACGYVGDLYLQGIVWDEKDNIQLMSPTSTSMVLTMASAIEKVGDHIYVAGIESPDGVSFYALLWTDNVPQRLVYSESPESVLRSMVVDIQEYDSDIYVLTQETLFDSDTYSVIWLNGKPIAKIDKELLSLAVN